jgi:hypothetical protein
MSTPPETPSDAATQSRLHRLMSHLAGDPKSFLLITAPFLLFVLLAGAFTVYWFWEAHTARRGIEAWFAEERAAGHEANYQSLAVYGFPYRIEARLTDVKLGRPDSALKWSASTPLLFLDALPLQLDKVYATLPKPVTISYRPAIRGQTIGAARRQWRITSSKMMASVHTEDGRLKRFSFDAPNLEGKGEAGGIFRAKDFQAHLREVPSAAAPGALAADMALSFDTLGWAARPSDTFQTVSFDFVGHLSGTRSTHDLVAGTMPLADALKAWAKEGGTFDLKKLDLHWGKLAIAGTGHLSLSPNGKPEGVIDARITGSSFAIEALVRAGKLKPDEGQVIEAALGVLALADQGAGAKDGSVTIPLTFAGGALRLGPAKLGELPSLY